jgi:HEAT repeat protein
MLNDPQGDLRAEAAAALGLTADPAAVAPLLAKIDDPDVAVREQIAGALGELQAPEAAEPLVALLKRDESPAVFSRAAQALARLGVIDAIWDIVPRMHRTANLGLRRELATAIGNVLGSPGQFYALLNDDLRRPGRRAAASTGAISRRLRHSAKKMARAGKFPESQHLKAAAKALRQAGRDSAAGRHGEAIDLMQRSVLEILSGLYDFSGQKELAEEFALSRSSRLGAGLWMLQSAGQYAFELQSDPEMVRLDALLGLYAIGEFVERTTVLKGRAWPLADRFRAWLRPRPGRTRQKVLAELRRIERESDCRFWASRPKTAARLVALLDDAEPAVRREAALALGRFGGDSAVEALLARLDDPDSDLQAEVVMALGLTGDARAAAPLLAKLTSPNEIIREYAAHALGELQRPEVAQALMELVRRDPSPNVFGRGALALARLGALDAVWEIMPRMHQSHNVGLRRQLAMAVGNLIGRPGEFYDLLNEEIHKPGSRVIDITRNTATVLRRKAKRSQAGPQADQAPHLLISAQQAELAAEEFEFQRYDLALEQQVTATLEMLRALYHLKSSDAVPVEWVLQRNRELGLGLWWLEKALDQARSHLSSPETLHLDTLLGFHFLHSFARALEK